MDLSPSLAGKTLPYARLRATIVDGRASNVFFRKNQLRRLTNELFGAKAELLQAIVNDSSSTPTEAWVEFYLAVAALKSYYDELDPEQELQDEYRIARNQDAADAREAVGIAYIQPDTHSYLYSVVVPVGAAIAAGNCVLVVVHLRPVVLCIILINCSHFLFSRSSKLSGRYPRWSRRSCRSPWILTLSKLRRLRWKTPHFSKRVYK